MEDDRKEPVSEPSRALNGAEAFVVFVLVTFVLIVGYFDVVSHRISGFPGVASVASGGFAYIMFRTVMKSTRN